MPPVYVFDVNETLLDLQALDPVFERVFGDAAAREQWFGQFIQSALVTIATGRYRDFGSIGMGALTMTAERRGKELTDADRHAVAEGMRKLPAHAEVHEALARLKDAGLRLAALTNSTRQVADAQLRNAGLHDLFEQVLSADDAGRLKPAPDPYRHAADRLGVSMGDVWLVAAHAWDVAGALAAGCHAAFIARPGKVPDPLASTPDLVATDMDDLATQLLARAGTKA
jgi:2-haloacid dehalogenase